MRLDAAEALANALIGLVLSWLITVFVLGFTAWQSAGITALFFGASTARSFLLRRIFRGLGC
jgi:uncharacterized membrane protein YgaE (UPF0421/DUF939 family)